MNNKRKTVLIGEDDSEVRGYLEMAVRHMGYDVCVAQDGEEALSCLQQNSDIDAVLLDIIMPRKDGIETLREIRRFRSTLPVIMVSDAASTTNVVQAMRLGATDFLAKPVGHGELRAVIQKATERVTLIPEADAQAYPPASGKVFFGSNLRMKEIRQMLQDIGPAEAPVLILGETGSGKEVIAREVHALSLRARKPFLKLNCAALPSELVESELFGYERGAFTGAYQKKAGMFEVADGGTILLDEIGDMDFKLQAKLLQVLQDHEFQRIGGKEMVHVDVRVVAATHQDLEHAMANRNFREDLYYRLNVIAIELPPLRERMEDIIPLAEFLISKYVPAGSSLVITSAMMQALMEYKWPGNIRELENVLRRYAILRDPDAIIRELRARMARRDLARLTPAATPGASTTNGAILAQVTKAKQEAETVAIIAALENTRWNRKQAATLLRIDYKALLYKMKKLGIDSDTVRLSATAGTHNRVAAAGTD